MDRATAHRIMMNLVMRKISLGRKVSADPVVFFGFMPEEVYCVHFWKADREGTWFRLHDGRVFDENGKPSETEEYLYKAPIPPPAIVL